MKKLYLLLTIILLLFVTGCKADTVTPTTATSPSSQTETVKEDTFIVATENETEKPTEKSKEKDDRVSVSSNTTVERDETSSSRTSSRNSSSSSSTTPTAAPAQAAQSNKVWHNAVYKAVEHAAETKEVWIVDKEAYSYEQPVYEFKDVIVCNICNQDVSDVQDEHKSEHTDDVTYRTENRYILTGTETIEVAEQGHYETIVTKEAYIEYVLVKEAGYY